LLTLIIPAKNEPYLSILLNKLKRLKNTEILIQTEEGLGNAVKKGVKKAKGNKIIIIDADGSHNPKYIPIFSRLLDKHSMVLGSRYIKDGYDKRKFYRRVISVVSTLFARLKLRNGVKDPLSGFFGFKKELLNNISLDCNGFKIGFEVMMKTKVKAKEIPIVLEERKMGKSKANFKEFISLVRLLCR
jgi:dolichol-phosphate mannosyltransferase